MTPDTGLPEGFVIDQPPVSGQGDLPPGFVLDSGSAAPQQAPPPPHKFGIIDTWPVRMAKGIYNAVTLPGDVWKYGYDPTHQAGVDPLSQEAIERSADLAAIATPMETAGAGRLLGGAARAEPPEPLPANVQAAQTALDVGSEGLPRGVVSPSRIVQATTQGAAQLPFVGPKIGERVENVIKSAGDKVKDISETLKPGLEDRADVGQFVRPGLKDAIERNNKNISDQYNAVRNMIDPQRQFELPATDAMLKRILQQRSKLNNPMQGLGDVANLVKRPTAPEQGPTVLRGMQGLEPEAALPWGSNFEELQRVRSDFGRKTQFGEPNPGYSEGERKMLHGAMTSDIKNMVREMGGDDAVNAFDAARTNAKQYMDQNKILQRLANKPSEESLAASLMKTANKDTGNIALLKQLRAQMPDQFQAISGQLLSELGHKGDEFSLAKFVTNWDKLSPEAKDALFEPSHKNLLEGISNMGKWIKGGEKYKGHSNTGHALALFEILDQVGHAVTHAATGNFGPAAKLAGGAIGGYGFARMLARPATASAVAKWTRAAQLYRMTPSARNRALVNIATRELVSNLGGHPVGQVIKALGPQAAEPDGNQPPSQGGIAPQRLQVRIPAQ
jgi:hypothetical protein